MLCSVGNELERLPYCQKLLQERLLTMRRSTNQGTSINWYVFFFCFFLTFYFTSYELAKLLDEKKKKTYVEEILQKCKNSEQEPTELYVSFYPKVSNHKDIFNDLQLGKV